MVSCKLPEILFSLEFCRKEQGLSNGAAQCWVAEGNVSSLSSVSSKCKYNGINLDDIHRTITTKRIKLNIYIFLILILASFYRRAHLLCYWFVDIVCYFYHLYMALKVITEVSDNCHFAMAIYLVLTIFCLLLLLVSTWPISKGLFVVYAVKVYFNVMFLLLTLSTGFVDLHVNLIITFFTLSN